MKNQWPLIVSALLFLVTLLFVSPTQKVFLVFSSILLEAMPFLMVGAFLAGLVEVYMPAGLLNRMLGGRPLLAAFAGLLLPICECGVVPVVKRMVKKGLPLQSAVIFLIASPAVNPVTIITTLSAFPQHPWMAGLRILIVVCMALLTGFLVAKMAQRRKSLFLKDMETEECASCGCSHHAPDHHENSHEHSHKTASHLKKVQEALRHGAHDLLDTGKYLILAAFVTAAFQVFFEQGISEFIKDVPAAGTFLMMSLSIILSLCSQTDAFIAAAYSGLVGLSAQLMFLVTGPVLDLKLIFMYGSLFKDKGRALIIGLLLAQLLLLLLILELGRFLI